MIVALVLLVVGGGLFWAALAAADGDYSLGGPRLAPILVTGLWVLIALINFLRSLRLGDPLARLNWLVPAGVLGCLAGFAIALEYAGFVVSAAVFIVLVARILGSRNWVRDVVVAVVLPLAVYFPFTRLLDIFLPAGVFPL